MGPRSARIAGQLLLTAAVAGALVLLARNAPSVDALKAAGVGGGTPIQGVGTFVDQIKGNLIWLAVTAVGCVAAVVGLLFMFGHSRAHDIAIKALLGAGIIASVGGIVS